LSREPKGRSRLGEDPSRGKEIASSLTSTEDSTAIRLVVRGCVDGIYFCPSPMPKEKPLLKIKITGPDLKPGHIPVQLLLKICGEVQRAVNRQAKALAGKPLGPGRHTKEVVQECNLDLVGLKKGSTTLDFVPAEEQQSMLLIGMDAVSGVGGALKFVTSKRSRAPQPDIGVLEALAILGEVFSDGVEKLEWIVPARNGTRKVTAKFDAKVLPKLKAQLQPPLPLGQEPPRPQPPDSFEGTLELTEGKGRIVPPLGEPTLFSFGSDKAAAVLEATKKPVKATVDPKTHKLKDIEVATLPWKADFFATKTIDQLIAEQGVQPIRDLSIFGFLSDEEVDDLIAAIHQGRQA
jgi:hypothetical protein